MDKLNNPVQTQADPTQVELTSNLLKSNLFSKVPKTPNSDLLPPSPAPPAQKSPIEEQLLAELKAAKVQKNQEKIDPSGSDQHLSEVNDRVSETKEVEEKNKGEEQKEDGEKEQEKEEVDGEKEKEEGEDDKEVVDDEPQEEAAEEVQQEEPAKEDEKEQPTEQPKEDAKEAEN